MKSIPYTVLLLILPYCGVALAVSTACPPMSKNITSSNNWIMLGGDAKGAVRQVVVGEFGKDVDSQKRVLGQFDQCGDLMVADISYDKNEGNVLLTMEQHIARVQRGWVAEYAYMVKVIKAGQEEVVDNRQGTISWQIGQHGNIVSSSDKFTSMGKDGFTDTTYRYDKQFRVEKSVARGSDSMTNGESSWRWNPQGLVTSSSSARSKDTYSYDNQWRELRLNGTSTTPVSTLRSVDECQLWDEVGNCTLSYLHETEVFAKGTIERHLSSAYKYQYWNASGETAAQD
ncbi:hypothetical protein [Pantoea trifolii]|uniref:YD repeat-containing protein n=1 Tax=Pantoea trifolii TaxID=2968030 RepID=A0ABT1VKE0_9GAMM|nr:MULTISPECIES: hypothetical protein [unclassified Pantoea]MCQ8227993.1 hypothetical protein [Pantoea sp. MMK2]MCQ8236166.1 hypothetical protein [Pantoea sp. MMK3]